MSGYLHKQWVGVWPDPSSPSEGAGPQTRNPDPQLGMAIVTVMLGM